MFIYKTIIFDLDGTLFKTDTIFLEALNKVCMTRGIEPWDRDKMIELIGKPMTDICRIIFGDTITDDEIGLVRDEVRAIEGKLLIESGMLYDGVAEMLNKLKETGYTLCICTNGSEIYANKILKNFGLTNKFSIIKSEVEGLSKEQQIKQILDESRCCSAIVVGDRTTDFEAANDAGCLSIGVSYGYGCNEYLQADFVANTPMNIYNIIMKINSVYYQVSRQIVKSKKKNKPLIVGINGVDTSGKTIFTKELSNYLNKVGCHVQTIHMDDFHNPSSIRYRDFDPILTYINNAFDLNRIETEILKPVIAKGLLDKEVTLLDLETDEFNITKKYEINHDTIILFEGVLLYRQPIDKYFDLRIYLDIPFDEVIKRASLRDEYLMGSTVIERYQQKYIPIQKRYIEKFHPMEKSEIIINNKNYEKPEIVVIKNHNIYKEKKCRVELKQAENEHLAVIRNLHKENDVREMLGVVELPDENYLKSKSSICYSILNENKEFIGIIEFFNISWKNRRSELSIIIKSEYRGKGYGYDSIKKILDIGFGELGFNRIWLRVLEHNSQAIKCYINVGFLKEGICREESMRFGKFQNQLQMSILKKEWILQNEN
ncbi:GNAT family N-acetyltransferase [Abyssisolibacter fermentans]|uniref:GNAT family N-acetyltransferase n=1 Tax=Abyssisolibacter fermentans TaxID=1766203 RepID=UPI0008325479|nr:GNAT family N-acetyltransferase [Abyssisolibacter fermentans]